MGNLNDASRFSRYAIAPSEGRMFSTGTPRRW